MKFALKTLLWIALITVQIVSGQSLKLTNTNQYVNIGDLDISDKQLAVESNFLNQNHK